MLKLNSKEIKDVRIGGMWKMEFVIPEEKKGQKVYVDVHSITKDTLKDEKGYYYIAKFDRKKEVIKREEKARTILNMIAYHMSNFAEPGIQNISIARKYSNSDAVYDPNDEYDSRILSTNACSEQYLSRESLCVLSSLNAGKFSIDKAQRDLELSVICESTQRFLDNVNECELVYHTYATPHQRLAIEKLRRTGTGITNLGGYLFKLNLEYGSKEGNDIVEDFIKMYNYYLYKTNIALGAEKGNFGLFDTEKIKRSAFIKNMMKTFPDLKFETMRCVTSSSIAPTGCTTKDTIIVTTEGNLSIKEIFEKNNINIDELEKSETKQWFDLKYPIYVLNIDGEIQRVTKLYYNGHDIVKIIEFENGEKFIGTHTTHKILVKSKEKDGYGIWKTLDTISEDDEIILEK